MMPTRSTEPPSSASWPRCAITHGRRSAFSCLPLTSHPVEELDELRHRLGGEVPGAVVALKPLDRESLRLLAAWYLPGHDAVALERVARRVGQDSAGIPFLAVELLSAIALGLDLGQGIRRLAGAVQDTESDVAR